MSRLEDKLLKQLYQRKENNRFRKLPETSKGLIDFSSNDYLGFSRSEEVMLQTKIICDRYQINQEGSTGSRLLTGNNQIMEDCERECARFHGGSRALLFNSGYLANLALISAVAGRNDAVIFDELCHASLRDGIRLSGAASFKFKHNNTATLEKIIKKKKNRFTNIFVVTESIFSMDGDAAPLKEISGICKNNATYLLIDEAHATGTVGEKGQGLCCQLEIEADCFARIFTFGKAMGSHGAAIVCGETLYQYLLNFSRPFIYTTALPPKTAGSILAAYLKLDEGTHLEKLRCNIRHFTERVKDFKNRISSEYQIQSFLFPGDIAVGVAAEKLRMTGLDVSAIRSPTIEQGRERLRVCLHAYNSFDEIEKLANLLRTLPIPELLSPLS